MGTYRIISGTRSIISWPAFFGIFLIEVGVAWFIASSNVYLGPLHLNFYNSFELMFGVLLLLHGLLKRGHPYRIGKVGTFLGVLFLALAFSSYFARGDYGLAVLFILLGLVVLIAAFPKTRRFY
jgi:peptidoglycan/LPS O-acetylase OafA/YrhL